MKNPPDPPAARIRVLLVEDHPATREGLRTALESQPDLECASEAGTWQEALRLAAELAPDVMVLDLHLPDGNGWSLLDQLSNRQVLPPTLVLSVCDEEVFARRLLRAGARGYLMKDEPVESVLRAIREVHAGGLVASQALRSRLMTEALALEPAPAPEDPAPAAEGLSDRELQVLGLIAEGFSNKEIAASLGLSEKTTHTYKTRLMTKLGVRTTPELEARYRAWKSPCP